MTPTGLALYAEVFRSAIEAHDFSQAQTSLQAYCTCLRSCSRTLPEIEEARALLQWGVRAAKAHKAHIAEELMSLKTICDAYGSPKRFHTWRMEG